MSLDCYLCGKSNLSKIMHVSNTVFSSNIDEYDILQCTRCGLATMFPFPEKRDIEEIYIKENTFSKPYVNPFQDSLFFSVLEPLYQKYGRDTGFIAKTCCRLAGKKDSLLDIGCSTGRLLSAFNALDPAIELTGIDIDPNSARNAVPFLKDKIIAGNFLKYQFEKKFDIITMTFVIEHLLEFKEYMEKSISLLNPGGLLFISTPDIDSRKARLLKSDWDLINMPGIKIGHLRWFNRKAINYWAASYNLRIVKYTCRGELSYYLPVSMRKLLTKTLGAEPSGNRLIKYYAPRIISALIFNRLSEIFSYGDCIYAFFQKN